MLDEVSVDVEVDDEVSLSSTVWLSLSKAAFISVPLASVS